MRPAGLVSPAEGDRPAGQGVFFVPTLAAWASHTMARDDPPARPAREAGRDLGAGGASGGWDRGRVAGRRPDGRPMGGRGRLCPELSGPGRTAW